MAQNNFIVDLIAGLKKTQSKQQIKADVKALGDFYLKLIGNLDMVKTRKYIRNQLKGLNNNTFTVTPTINTKGVQNATKKAVSNAQKVANSNKVYYSFDVDKQKLQNQLKNFAKENSKLFSSKEMTAKYNQLVDSASIAKSKAELKGLRSQLSAFRTELVAVNKAGMTWTDKFKASIAHFAQYFSGASFIYFMTNQFRSAWTEAKTLDDSLTDLMKVTNEIEDRDALYKYFDKAMSKAKELNVTVDSLIYAITEFKKLGWSLSDAELGGQWATILENVGDVDIDTAIGSIKTAIASFDEIGGYGNDQMDKKLEAYVDLINNMSNKYSIDAQGLSEAIRLSAGTLTEANTSIEQAATMFATANKYYNDPDYLGNTAKIGSLRLRATTGDDDAIKELSEMGEDVEEVTALTGKLREELIALTGVDIMVDNNTFKSYYDQLYEISQVIDDLDDTTSAKVLEMLFGKNRAAAGASLLSGLQDSEQAYKDALNSAGSATIEYEKWTQSADAACQRFKNSVTEMYQSIISGNTVRDIANVGSALLDFANKFGIIEGTIKGFLALKIGGFLTNASMAFLTATKSIEQYGKALQLANNIPNGNLSQRYATLKSIAQATSSLTTVQLKQVLSSQQLTQQDRIRILQMQGMTKEMALQKLAEMNLTQATNAQTAANTASTASTFSLKSAMVGLGATMKSVFLSNPAGIVLMGLSVGVSAVTSAISNHNQKLEEMRQNAKQAAEEANTLGDEVAELANKYIALSEAVKTDASAKEDLMTTQAELLKKLGLEGESIDDLIDRYGSLSNAIKQASIDSLQNSRIDLLAGLDAAKEELLDVGSDGFWGGNNIINATGKDAVKAFGILEQAGIVGSGSYGTGGGSLVLTGDDKSVNGILENYKKLEDAIKALEESNAFTAEELSENSLFTAMYARYSEMKDEVEAYNSSINELNENLAQEMMLTALQGSELPNTEEEFEKFRQELIDTSIASKQFIGNEKEITDAVNNYLSTVPEFEGFYSIPLENELDKVDALLGQECVSNTFTDTISQVQSLTEGLDKLDQIYADVLDKESFDWSSILNNKGFKETFGGLGAAYDDFIKTISNSPNDIDACQSAFDNLATAYIQNSDALSDLTEETKQASIAMLEEMGIKNAEEVVTSILIQKEGELAAQKILAANSTYTLTNLTTAEIDRLLIEGIVTEQTSKQLAIFALQKQLSNNYRIETEEEVNRIYNLAKMAGIGAEALAKFAQFKNDLENTTDARTRSWIIKSINTYKSTLFKEIDGVKTNEDIFTPVKYTGGKATKSAASSAKKEAKKTMEDIQKDWKEYLDKYLALYKAELDAGLIDFQTFLNKSRSLLDEFYRDGKISAKDYWDSVGNLYQQQLDVYDKVISAVTKRIDKEIDGIQDIIDGLEKQNDALQNQLDEYDGILKVVDDVYQTEIDSIKQKQDAIDDTISKLQDENDEKQRAIDLEKARYQLYRALNNRNVKLYNGKEYIYTHDREEVRDAQQNLADLELQETVAGLEKEKNALDEVIAELEKYRDLWSEISSAKQNEEYKQLAIAIWGKDYEKLILSNRISDIESFKDNYIHIQQQIEDNQGLIDSYNEKIEYYDALKQAWNAVATEREETINREIAAQVLGATWENDILNGRMEVLNNFRNQYLATQQAIVDAAWNAANAQIAALNAIKSAESTSSQTSSSSKAPTVSGNKNTPTKKPSKPSKPNANSGGGISNLPTIEKYGSGTDNAKPGWHEVAESGNEIIRDNNGNAYIAKGRQIHLFEGGETVYSASDTRELLSGSISTLDAGIGEVVVFDHDKMRKNLQQLIPDYMNTMPSMINIPRYNVDNVRSGNPININIGDINLHEVQSVDGLAKAIIRELPGKVNQAMYRR